MTDTRHALAERDTSKPAEKQGLFDKFKVLRRDGSSEPGEKHDGREYFVLDIDHDPHAKAALAAYADDVEATHPYLAKDMRARYALSAQPVAGAVALTDEQRKAIQMVLWHYDGDPDVSCLGDLLATPQPQAAPAPEPTNVAGETPMEHAHRWATELAVSMAKKFYPEVPQFKPLSDLVGVISQIDNMTCGLVRAAPEPSAQAVREPGDPLHDDAYVRGVAVGFVEDDSRRTTLLRIADRMQKLAASPQPEPSAQGEPVAWISPKDRVPKGGEVVLCLFRDKGIHTALFRGTSTTHGVFEAWHGFLVADLPTDRVIGWVPLASAPSTPQPAVVEAVPLTHDQVWQDDEVMEWNAVAGQSIYNIMRLVRIVERHHKIGIAPKAAQPN